MTEMFQLAALVAASHYFTGVGSRKTPIEVLALMTAIARKLVSMNYILRSGGAKGADTAFEKGAGNSKRIYYANDATYAAMGIAAQYHGAWHRCSEYAKKLHGRNAFQVLGDDLQTPSRWVICWTPDACLSHETRGWNTGGTGTAISIGDANGVPIVNLANKEMFSMWRRWAHAPYDR